MAWVHDAVVVWRSDHAIRRLRSTPMPTASADRRIELRSLALHRSVAEMIRRDPLAIERALSNLVRWETSVQCSWIGEWRELLLGPRERLLTFLTEQSERADRLRQSSPFASVLPSSERRRIHESHAA